MYCLEAVEEQDVKQPEQDGLSKVKPGGYMHASMHEYATYLKLEGKQDRPFACCEQY